MTDEERKELKLFEELFKAQHGKLCILASRIIRDKDAARDVVQDVFYKLWNKRKDLNLNLLPNSYLYKAVVNTSLDYLEKTKRLQLNNEAKDTVGSLANNAVNSKMDCKEIDDTYKEALEMLPPKCRAIFILSRYEGLKHKEIADQLQISIKTVETQISIALERMREKLKPFLNKDFLTVLLLFFLFY